MIPPKEVYAIAKKRFDADPHKCFQRHIREIYSELELRETGAFDEKTHRLFIGTRTPPQMIVMDSNTGKEVAALPTVEGMDGVYFNAGQKRIYVSGGRDNDVGYVFVYQQKDADHYEAISKIPMKSGAGTSFWSPELNRFYVGAPAHDSEEAAILVYEPQP